MFSFFLSASFPISENNFGNKANQMQMLPHSYGTECQEIRFASLCNINRPHITHGMFIPHSGTGFLPSILFGMYECGGVGVAGL